ncbi:MAG: zinc ribbon domain-containing protein [Verrucomicrobia bacterium]|nr:zinc ribbon domain-containing protein [Verrucomicrobiota bacterium]MCG2681661.1 zinc ribbon domain-containing protein [Kiritimatiellia bacterium]MBU4248114.1 zinc ribbon domain-containing protein [Verrucomicrobiota bacterium]MBU4290790.1 zinc ribbon domain-containing protein [Verrucomicrobiota bacterium]MBU4429735.1 zinc ribbon domain-containing protein [Verrucomicrobiota bacterium]
MTKQITEQRKSAYYFGMILMIIGGLMFFSVFITGAMNFGNFSNFQADAQSSMLRAIGGMALLITGVIIRSIGARGLAGSGVVLDPEKARQELEPYSRMAGGMVKDALDEANVSFGGKAEKVIMIKCPACGKLNEEDSKFCQECSKQM